MSEPRTQRSRRTPRYRIGFRRRRIGPAGVYEQMPFKRSPIATLIIGGMIVPFCIPYFELADIGVGSSNDTLFGLVATLFSLFWLAGWSVGVAFLVLLFLGTLFARETVEVRPGLVILRRELFGIGLESEYPWAGVRGLRRVFGKDAGRQQWRGPHLAFDYDDTTVRFGCDVDDARAERILREIRAVAPSVDREPASRPLSEPTEPSAQASGAVAVANRAPRSSTSVCALVIANLVPLLGVLFADWRIGDIMLLFWAESAIVGFYNLLKMWVIGRWAVLLAGPFFAAHFGGFMVVHLLFIYELFIRKAGGPDVGTAQVLADFLALWPALLGLAISHGISFRENFLGRHEYRDRSINDQMGEPYTRIVVMHLTLLAGGFGVMLWHDRLLPLLALIGLKVLADLRGHRRQHGPEGAARARKRREETVMDAR